MFKIKYPKKFQFYLVRAILINDTLRKHLEQRFNYKRVFLIFSVHAHKLWDGLLKALVCDADPIDTPF